MSLEDTNSNNCHPVIDEAARAVVYSADIDEERKNLAKYIEMFDNGQVPPSIERFFGRFYYHLRQKTVQNSDSLGRGTA